MVYICWKKRLCLYESIQSYISPKTTFKGDLSIFLLLNCFLLSELPQGNRTIRKSAKVVTMSLEGGDWGYPLSLAFGGTGGSDYFLSLAFGGKFSHKLDHFWPN